MILMVERMIAGRMTEEITPFISLLLIKTGSDFSDPVFII